MKATPLLLCALPVMAVATGSVIVVSQKGRAFSVGSLHMHKGDTVHFTNEDVFDHQIYVDSPGFKFSSPEQEPGSSTDIQFSATGTFNVQCEIHPRMHLAVTVD